MTKTAFSEDFNVKKQNIYAELCKTKWSESIFVSPQINFWFHPVIISCVSIDYNMTQMDFQ